MSHARGERGGDSWIDDRNGDRRIGPLPREFGNDVLRTCDLGQPFVNDRDPHSALRASSTTSVVDESACRTSRPRSRSPVGEHRHHSERRLDAVCRAQRQHSVPRCRTSMRATSTMAVAAPILGGQRRVADGPDRRRYASWWSAVVCAECCPDAGHTAAAGWVSAAAISSSDATTKVPDEDEAPRTRITELGPRMDIAHRACGRAGFVRPRACPRRHVQVDGGNNRPSTLSDKVLTNDPRPERRRRASRTTSTPQPPTNAPRNTPMTHCWELGWFGSAAARPTTCWPASPEAQRFHASAEDPASSWRPPLSRCCHSDSAGRTVRSWSSMRRASS